MSPDDASESNEPSHLTLRGDEAWMLGKMWMWEKHKKWVELCFLFLSFGNLKSDSKHKVVESNLVRDKQ